MTVRRIAIVCLVSLVCALMPSLASASHEDGYYEIGAWDMWDTPRLNVLIVPPGHGPIFAEGGWLETRKTDELTPFNTYLRAVEDSIAAWDAGVRQFGSEQLRESFRVNAYVLGRDLVPADALASPDIIITTTDDTPLGLGVAIRPYPCIVNNSEVYGLMGYVDMYNVNGQEYGHCLGVEHVGKQGGFDPLAQLQHPEHDIMNGFYTHEIGEAETHLHCISNLDVSALEFVFSHGNGPIPVWSRTGGQSSLAASDYQTLPCHPDAPGLKPEPAPAPSPSPSPSASPSPSSTPSQPDAAAPPQSAITAPAHREKLPRHAVRNVRGTVEGDATGTEFALMRKKDATCLWWDGARNRFVARSCTRPLWFPTSGAADWSYSFTVRLPRGSYEARSRAVDARTGYVEQSVEEGRNMVSFRLR